ncbi:sodium/potassium-transporting ATPase subunit beta-like [Physella acuta]|uniref:sodium/potassium-transporting ATPase subunit beta-like n=1 Tax=Physella acuta TaxID=109671 RepID=UPI0027DC400B|nr:sodium/potassium-transporting ATPase subunit beta-like [Physella acuta]XP_059157494.1 sodium/potassium-transporting ATPase subunit beta-like [Physella acuta]
MSANPYDPITTTDSSYLADDDWGLSLPPLRYKTYTGVSRLKRFCSEIRHHPKCLIASIATVCVIILISIIIAVASNDHGVEVNKEAFAKWTDKSALVFYPKPQDGTVLISFVADDFKKSEIPSIKASLNNVTAVYNSALQLDDTYADCSYTNAPYNKTCKYTKNSFGDWCVATNNYGYGSGQPCVFIELNLKEDQTMQLINDSNSRLWNLLDDEIKKHNDPSNIPFTCKGTDKNDEKLLLSGPEYGGRIFYSPKTGFPSFIYRKRNTDMPFLKPGIMLQFPSLYPKELIHVTCTVWGQIYSLSGTILPHDLLTTQFAIYYKS